MKKDLNRVPWPLCNRKGRKFGANGDFRFGIVSQASPIQTVLRNCTGLWEAAEQDRLRLPHRDRRAKRLAEARNRKALITHLDHCLPELISGGQLATIQ